MRRLVALAVVLLLLPVGAGRADAAGDGRAPRIVAAVASPARRAVTISWQADEPTDGDGGQARSHVLDLMRDTW